MGISYTKTKLTCYSGFVVQAIVNNFLPILFIIFKSEYGLTYEELGRLIFINFFVQVFADFLTAKISDIIGYRKTAILSQSGAAFGLILLCITPLLIDNIYIAIVIPLVFYAFSSGVMEVILSPMVELLPTKNKGANMAFLHSFYCWGQSFTVLGTTFLVKVFGFDLWYFVPAIWAIIPIVNSVMFSFVPIIEPDVKDKKEKREKFFFTRDFFCFVIFMLCAGASEIAMAQWASMFAQKGLGVSKVIGDLLGPCAFGIFMGVGRVVYGWFSGRYSVKRVLILNNILCFACYLIVGICDIPALSLVACALCGFSVSLSWPGTYSLAAARFKNVGTIMFSVFALCGDFGCAMGPWLLGAVADLIGLKNGFLACTVFPFAMILTALFLFKENDCNKDQTVVK